MLSLFKNANLRYVKKIHLIGFWHNILFFVHMYVYVYIPTHLHIYVYINSITTADMLALDLVLFWVPEITDDPQRLCNMPPSSI